MTPRFATDPEGSVPIHVIGSESLSAQLEALPAPAASWAEATAFRGKLGDVRLVPSETGATVACVLAGSGTPAARSRTRLGEGRLPLSLPVGTYHFASGVESPDQTALAWLLGSYQFTRYKAAPRAPAELVVPEGADGARLEAIAAGEFLTRDLINTPAADMGPDALEQAVRALAEEFSAKIEATVGAALLTSNLPMIHTVGRAAEQAPRLLDLRWGDAGPALTLVGKGVCFDTGGLNLKPGGSMGLMKKDMGGAANVLGLARMIMALNWPVKLRVLIPAVENSVAGNAFRPQDVLTSRKGLTVEINNTDAEGRLVLADALTLAAEESPDQIISMATLTGAARVAVGPDLAPYYSGNEVLSAALQKASATAEDPVWRMPFHAPYEAMIEPAIADLDNAPKGGFAGSITAALFLRRFIEDPGTYTHFDIYGWQPKAEPGRPQGGAAQGIRALLGALPDVLGL